jgi:hypothetical protein
MEFWHILTFQFPQLKSSIDAVLASLIYRFSFSEENLV